MIPCRLSRRVDGDGVSQVPWRSFLCLCPAPGPRSDRRRLTITATPVLPPMSRQRRLRRSEQFRGCHQASALAVYASRALLPGPGKTRLRLVGSPLPRGHRTRWIAAKGFRSHDRPPSQGFSLALLDFARDDGLSIPRRRSRLGCRGLVIGPSSSSLISDADQRANDAGRRCRAGRGRSARPGRARRTPRIPRQVELSPSRMNPGSRCVCTSPRTALRPPTWRGASRHLLDPDAVAADRADRLGAPGRPPVADREGETGAIVGSRPRRCRATTLHRTRENVLPTDEARHVGIAGATKMSRALAACSMWPCAITTTMSATAMASSWVG